MKTVRMLAIVALAIWALTATANAQTVQGKVTLPYEVHWGTATLPPGDYTISMDSFHTATLVQSANNNISFYTHMPVAQDKARKAPRSLLITSFQGQRRVRSLNLPEYGRSLVYEPLTKAEREEIAKAGQEQAVAVIIAKK